MDIYIAIAIILSIAAIVKNKIFNLLCLISLFVVAAFRSYSVGTDTENYLFAFNYLNSHDTLDFVLFKWSSHLEYFYRVLFYFIKKTGFDYRMVLIVQSILFLFSLGFFYEKKTKNLGLALLLTLLSYFFFQFFNVSRQMLAISLCGFSYLLLSERRYKQCLISIALIAFFVHTTCFLLCLLVIFDKYKKEIPPVLVLGLLVVSFVFPYALGNLNFLEGIVNYFGYVKFDLYFLENNRNVYLGRVLPTVVFAFLYFYFKKTVDYKSDIFFKAYFLQVLSYNLFAAMPVVGDRMMLVFMLGTIVYWCRVIAIKPYSLLPIISMNLYSFIAALNANSGEIVPFKFL